jgi:hypothetical protein
MAGERGRVTLRKRDPLIAYTHDSGEARYRLRSGLGRGACRLSLEVRIDHYLSLLA